MNKIKKYMLIRGYASEVEAGVNRYIDEGWQPFGSLASSDRNNSTYPILIQAMVKYDKD